MFGYQLTAKKESLSDITSNHQFKMLLVSISIGVLTGYVIAFAKLKLGMPGHKVFMWLMPVLIARLCGGSKIGTGAGGLSAAITTHALGANLSGGFIGMPLIFLAGTVLDCIIHTLEKNKFSIIYTIVAITLAGTVAGFICWLKRLILPSGLSAHYLFGLSGFWFKLLSYLFFGTMAGLIASICSYKAFKKRLKQNDFTPRNLEI